MVAMGYEVFKLKTLSVELYVEHESRVIFNAK